MPSKKQPTDPDHQLFNQKHNVWQGMSVKADPAAIKDNQIAFGENIRYTLDGYRERYGTEKGTSNVLGAVTVQSLFEAGDIGAAQEDLYIEPLVPGIYEITNAPASGDWFSHSLEGTTAVKIQLPTLGIATFARPFQAQGKLVIGKRVSAINTNLQLYQWNPTDGLTVGYEITSNFANSSWRGRAFSSGVEFGDHFYFSLHYDENLADFPRPHHLLIYKWDGLTTPVLEKEQIFNQLLSPSYADIGTFNIFALYATDDVYAITKASEGAEGAGPTPGNLVLRRNGGSWGTLTLPSFGASAYFGGCLTQPGLSYGAVVEYNGATYIAGAVQQGVSGFITAPKKLKILRVDGSSLTEVWTRTQSSQVGYINLFVADGIMYYNYSDAVTSTYKMGSFNGTTWNDNVKDWTASPQSTNLIPWNVIDFGGELWCSLQESGLLRKTTGRDVAGLWSSGTFDVDHGSYLDVLVS